MATIPGTPFCPPTKEARIAAIMNLMRQLRWVRGRTDKWLANRWGLRLDAIQNYSAEAWRRVKAEVTQPDATAATVCLALERVIHESKDKGLAGHRSIIEAGKTWAQIAGAGAPTRFEIGPLAALSDEELERKRREILARLQTEEHPALPQPTDENSGSAEASVEPAGVAAALLVDDFDEDVPEDA